MSRVEIDASPSPTQPWHPAGCAHVCSPTPTSAADALGATVAAGCACTREVLADLGASRCFGGAGPQRSQLAHGHCGRVGAEHQKPRGNEASGFEMSMRRAVKHSMRERGPHEETVRAAHLSEHGWRPGRNCPHCTRICSPDSRRIPRKAPHASSAAPQPLESHQRTRSPCWRTLGTCTTGNLRQRRGNRQSTVSPAAGSTAIRVSPLDGSDIRERT